MIKVTGTPDYSVMVECPNLKCKHSFDAINEFDDQDNRITKAMFKNTKESCHNMNIEISCDKCDELFLLDALEY